MFIYPNKATTNKDINRVNYNINYATSINQLKYNNDNSAVLRVLSSLIDTSDEIAKDIPYVLNFDMNTLDYTTIDRIHGFSRKYISNINTTETADNIICSKLYGYSRYTNKEYELYHINDKFDFARHSLPCDTILSDYITSPTSYEITLHPYIKSELKIPVINSQITIKQISGFEFSSLNNTDRIKLEIEGLDIANNFIREEITIEDVVDIKTKNEYSFISTILLNGSNTNAEIIVYPYILGEMEVIEDYITTKEYGDVYDAVITVDKENKLLVFNTLTKNKVSYPSNYELYKTIPIDIPASGTISNHFIDKHNELLYITTSDNILYCFPLIIPKTDNNTLDTNKTKFQSVRVSYEEDCINQKYDLYIFPTSRFNDVQMLNISINGTDYISDIMLDLLIEGLETNKFEISFYDLFKDGDTALVELYAYGEDISRLPILLDRTKLKALYTKNLSVLDAFSASNIDGYSKPILRSTFKPYRELKINTTRETIELFKLSSFGQVLVNGIRIQNIYNTFYYDENTDTIITSDTITGIKG